MYTLLCACVEETPDGLPGLTKKKDIFFKDWNVQVFFCAQKDSLEDIYLEKHLEIGIKDMLEKFAVVKRDWCEIVLFCVGIFLTA